MSKKLFTILTDSAADMPCEYYEKNEVVCLNLGFSMNGENYLGQDGKFMEVTEFYQLLRDGAMPTTTQISPQYAKEELEKLLAEGKDVLVLSFSSGMSGTCNSYKMGSKELIEEYPDRTVTVVDGLCASMGQGLLLDYVVKKADEGATLEETAKYAEDLKLQICHEVTVNDLFHLKRGGRVSGTTAVVGSILKIKPIIYVDNEGHLVSIGKAMGRKKSISTLVETMGRQQALIAGEPIFISHGDCIEDAEYLKNILAEKYPENPITINHIGPVIGSHAGVGTLALFYRGKARLL